MGDNFKTHTNCSKMTGTIYSTLLSQVRKTSFEGIYYVLLAKGTDEKFYGSKISPPEVK